MKTKATVSLSTEDILDGMEVVLRASEALDWSWDEDEAARLMPVIDIDVSEFYGIAAETREGINVPPLEQDR